MSDLDKNSSQGAADEDPNVSLTQQRVAVIVDLKMRLKWKRLSARRLAQQWGLSEEYVTVLASKANTIVRRSCVDPDTLAADLLPDLMATFKAASRSVRDPGGDPHAQAKMAASAASLAKILVDVGGLEAPKTTKTELTGADGGPVRMETGVLVLPPEDG